MEGFDIWQIVGTIAVALVGVVASFYAGFRTGAKNDGVQDWKDSVVAAIDGLAAKIDENNKQ
jgi:hypothetical protein